MKFVETREELRARYGSPSEKAARKVLDRLDRHARAFLDHCPFVAVGTQDRSGNADVTPRGDRPGFIAVLDDRTLAIPDRPGNQRLDTFENLLENPAVGLLCLIPGMQETLRINGTARLTFDADLCTQLGVNGRPAQAVMLVEIAAVYMHCAKAFLRSSLWKPETWPPRDVMPSFGEILRDQLALETGAEEIDAALDQSYQKTMW